MQVLRTRNSKRFLAVAAGLCWAACAGGFADKSLAAELRAGFHAVDITPPLNSGQPIYLAGLDSNRVAKEIKDRLYARAVVLESGGTSIALVSVDSIGVQRPTIVSARGKLPDVDYVLVASTHTHCAPDCIGLWGPSQTESGVSPAYMQQLEQGIVDAVRGAAAATVPARASYGTAADQALLGDYRLPEVYDSVLRVVRFDRLSDGKPCGMVVQWNAHGIEPDNPVVTRDFFGATVDELSAAHSCPVVYFSGAVGGLMGTPKPNTFLNEETRKALDIFEFIEMYGQAVAGLADKALAAAKPIELTPLAFSTQEIAIPLDNEGYVGALKIGVLTRPVVEWTGRREVIGDPVSTEQADGALAFVTEVAYLRLGELHIAAIPGELYPELVYGEFQQPVDPGADFPEAPLEKPVMEILPGEKTLLLGLANDEVGYIVPKRQWDVMAPFCYGRDSAQYGERNSVGPETARMLSEALADRVRELSR
jgi:hypothetical protein